MTDSSERERTAPRAGIAVIGAGISGLTTAAVLAERGHDVTLIARDATPDSTSSVAAAVWYPFHCFPRDRVIAWSRKTYSEIERRAIPDPASGVRERRYTEFLGEPSPDPWWRPAVDRLDRVAPHRLPKGYADGYVIRSFVMDTSRYLPWLNRKLEGLGVRREIRELSSLAEATGFDAVVNCTGLGARELCGDTSVSPVRGQVVLAENPGIEEVLVDESGDITYLIPREGDLVIGGSAKEGSFDTTVDDEETRAILSRARRLLGNTAEFAVREVRVGLRPARPAVRLELERKGTRLIAHNYGHGGAGFTLSFGCATDLADLLEAALGA